MRGEAHVAVDPPTVSPPSGRFGTAGRQDTNGSKTHGGPHQPANRNVYPLIFPPLAPVPIGKVLSAGRRGLIVRIGS